MPPILTEKKQYLKVNQDTFIILNNNILYMCKISPQTDETKKHEGMRIINV